MEQRYLYIIGMGNPEDWRANSGGVYLIKRRNGEKALPVFSTRELANQYWRDDLEDPQAYMRVPESILEPPAKSLTEGRFLTMPVTEKDIFMVAGIVGAAHISLDPRPGDNP